MRRPVPFPPGGFIEITLDWVAVDEAIELEVPGNVAHSRNQGYEEQQEGREQQVPQDKSRACNPTGEVDVEYRWNGQVPRPDREPAFLDHAPLVIRQTLRHCRVEHLRVVIEPDVGEVEGVSRVNCLQVLLQVAVLRQLYIRLEQHRNRAEIPFQRVDLGEIRTGSAFTHFTTTRRHDGAERLVVIGGPRLLLSCARSLVGGERLPDIRSQQRSRLVERIQHKDLDGTASSSANAAEEAVPSSSC